MSVYVYWRLHLKRILSKNDCELSRKISCNKIKSERSQDHENAAIIQITSKIDDAISFAYTSGASQNMLLLRGHRQGPFTLQGHCHFIVVFGRVLSPSRATVTSWWSSAGSFHPPGPLSLHRGLRQGPFTLQGHCHFIVVFGRVLSPSRATVTSSWSSAGSFHPPGPLLSPSRATVTSSWSSAGSFHPPGPLSLHRGLRQGPFTLQGHCHFVVVFGRVLSPSRATVTSSPTVVWMDENNAPTPSNNSSTIATSVVGPEVARIIRCFLLARGGCPDRHIYEACHDV